MHALCAEQAPKGLGNPLACTAWAVFYLQVDLGTTLHTAHSNSQIGDLRLQVYSKSCFDLSHWAFVDHLQVCMRAKQDVQASIRWSSGSTVTNHALCELLSWLPATDFLYLLMNVRDLSAGIGVQGHIIQQLSLSLHGLLHADGTTRN